MNALRRLPLCLLLALSIAADGRTRQLPEAPERFLIGVATSFARGGDLRPRLLDMLGQIGANSIREGVNWGRFPRAVTFRPLPEGVSATMSGVWAARARGVRPLLILAYGHDGIDGGGRPYSPGGFAAFARYARAVADLTQESRPIFEVWNEWNYIGGGSNDAASADQYVRLAATTMAAVQDATGGTAPIVIGAAARDPGWAWSRRIAASGILRRAAGFSVHLYNYRCDSNPANRSPGEMMRRLDELERVLTAASGLSTVPVYVTEVGWPSSGKCAVSEEQGAAMMGQAILSFVQRPWIKGMWLYELRDRADDPADKEANFGLYRFNLTAKPAACIYARLARIARTATPDGLETMPNGVTVSRFQLSGTPITALWSSLPGSRASVWIRGQPAKTAPPCGPPVPFTGRPVSLGDMPLLIFGRVAVAPA